MILQVTGFHIELIRKSSGKKQCLVKLLGFHSNPNIINKDYKLQNDCGRASGPLPYLDMDSGATFFIFFGQLSQLWANCLEHFFISLNFVRRI